MVFGDFGKLRVFTDYRLTYVFFYFFLNFAWKKHEMHKYTERAKKSKNIKLYETLIMLLMRALHYI